MKYKILKLTWNIFCNKDVMLTGWLIRTDILSSVIQQPLGVLGESCQFWEIHFFFFCLALLISWNSIAKAQISVTSLLSLCHYNAYKVCLFLVLPLMLISSWGGTTEVPDFCCKKALGLPAQLLLKAVDLQYKNWSRWFVFHLSRGLLLLLQLEGAS